MLITKSSFVASPLLAVSCDITALSEWRALCFVVLILQWIHDSRVSVIFILFRQSISQLRSILLPRCLIFSHCWSFQNLWYTSPVLFLYFLLFHNLDKPSWTRHECNDCTMCLIWLRMCVSDGWQQPSRGYSSILCSSAQFWSLHSARVILNFSL